jgi:hypothetical protein
MEAAQSIGCRRLDGVGDIRTGQLKMLQEDVTGDRRNSKSKTGDEVVEAQLDVAVSIGM